MSARIRSYRPLPLSITGERGTQPYIDLEQEVARGEFAAIEARWRFGKLLAAERAANGGKQLPDGRLAEIRAATGCCPREIQYRLQFAETHPHEQQVRTAVRTCGSWTEIRASLAAPPGRRRRGSWGGPEDAAGYRRHANAEEVAYLNRQLDELHQRNRDLRAALQMITLLCASRFGATVSGGE